MSPTAAERAWALAQFAEGWALSNPAWLIPFGIVMAVVVIAAALALYFRLTDGADPELAARDAETERLWATTPQPPELHHTRFVPPVGAGDPAWLLPRTGGQHRKAPRRAAGVTPRRQPARAGAPPSPAAPLAGEARLSHAAAGTTWLHTHITRALRGLRLGTLLPIRGDAQGRDGGCAPAESRPAPGAGLTGSLSPRRHVPHAVAHQEGARLASAPLAVPTMTPATAPTGMGHDGGTGQVQVRDGSPSDAPGALSGDERDAHFTTVRQPPGPGSEPCGVTGPAPDLHGYEPLPPPASYGDHLAALAAIVGELAKPTDEERWPHLVAGSGYADTTGTFAAICADGA